MFFSWEEKKRVTKICRQKRKETTTAERLNADGGGQQGGSWKAISTQGPPCCYTRINAEDKNFFLGYLITDNQGSAPGFLKPKQCRYLVIFSYFFPKEIMRNEKEKNRVSSNKTKLTSKRIKHPVQLLLHSLFFF